MSLSGRATLLLKELSFHDRVRKESFLDIYSLESNPSGVIILAVAENKLCGDMLKAALDKYFQDPAGLPVGIFNYTDATGMPEFKEILAGFLADYVFQAGPVDAQQLIVTTGCIGGLDKLSTCLFEDGDSVLIPIPYYPAFDKDFADIAHVVTVEVRTVMPGFLLTNEILDEAFERAKAEGHPPRALLLSNPVNPTGITYDAGQLLLAVSWCRKNSLHLIMDEIYALSNFDSSRPFLSVSRVLDNDLGDDIHIIWSLSKDFGASGLRLGVLYSQNQRLVRAASILNDFFQVSNLIQYAACKLLSDRYFLSTYLPENAFRIKRYVNSPSRSYEFLVGALTKLGVGFLSASSGIFVFADFGPLFRLASFEDERDLHVKFVKVCRLLFTPGEICHVQTPGCFRICYAWVPFEVLKIAIERLENFVGRFRACTARSIKDFEV